MGVLQMTGLEHTSRAVYAGAARIAATCLKIDEQTCIGEGDPAGPAEVKRGWRIVDLDTDEGLRHLAAGDAALNLLEERL